MTRGLIYRVTFVLEMLAFFLHALQAAADRFGNMESGTFL